MNQRKVYYAKWVADVVIIPGFFILVAYGVLAASRLHRRLSRSQPSLMSQAAGDRDHHQGHHEDDCDHRHMPTASATISAAYTVIFFLLPRMTTTVFQAFLCRDLSRPSELCDSWLTRLSQHD